MRLRGLLTLMLICLAAPAAWAGACPAMPGLPPPQLEFLLQAPRMRLHHDVDLFGLPRLANHMETPPRGWALQGLTVAQARLTLTARWRQMRLRGGGGVCVWLDQVKAVMGVPEQQVYVAANYPEGSCEYNAILRHERLHVGINARTTAAFAAPMRTLLWRTILDNRPLLLRVDSVDPAMVIGRLQAGVRPEMARLQSVLRARNGVIDTPAAYRRQELQAGCHRWRIR